MISSQTSHFLAVVLDVRTDVVLNVIHLCVIKPDIKYNSKK